MIGLIVAYSKNRVIGNKGHLPWNIKGELTRFKALTTNSIIVMGRNTFMDIGRVLPNRTTYVVSSSLNFQSDNCFTVGSLTEALNLSKGKDVFIVGGYRLYHEAISIVDKMFVTEIKGDYDGDVYFPEFNENDFVRIVEKENDLYRYVTYIRK